MKYIPTIGIETHVQLKSKTKLFAAISNDARQASPNTLISHICLGMPGALPALNQGAIELACKAAFALQVEPQRFSTFDRKHYFYPDLPKGYQISQFYHPIIKSGHVDIQVEGKLKKIGITRAHLEEDAGKTIHPPGKNYSLVDLNRAGTPLLEIVSQPDMHSPEQAKAYAQKLYLLMKYADISDVDLYLGNMRFDVNVSLSQDPKRLGVRTETKNLNSFKAVYRAVEFEIDRQAKLLDKGKPVLQETRGWDDAKQKTTSQRGKEESHDYRYMPDPDIPPLDLDDEFLARIKAKYEKRNFQVIEDQLKSVSHLTDGEVDVLFNNPEAVDFALELIKQEKNEKALPRMLDWLINVIPSIIHSWSVLDKRKDLISGLMLLAEATEDGQLVSSTAKHGIERMIKEPNFNVRQFLRSNKVINDTGRLSKIVEDELENNQEATNDVLQGQDKAIGFLIGQVMQKTGGKADPKIVKDLIKKQLGVD